MAAAYAALVSLLKTIDDIRRHPSPPITLHTQQVEYLTEIVGFLQGFLEDYVSPHADGDEADPLEMRIADAAYAAQDVIESHIVENIRPTRSSHESKCSHYLFNCLPSPNNPIKKEQTNLYEDVQQVIEEMDSIKKELVERQNSGLVIHDQSHRFVSAPSVPTLRSSSSSSAGQSSGMVCSEDVLLAIKEKLVSWQLDLQTIPIVGMGGIGKTVLAKTVYSDKLIKERFYICAWATISQQYDVREILSELFSEAAKIKKKDLRGWSVDKLGEELSKHLFGRRFLVVMDDMWDIKAWDQVQRFFPNNKNSSRVLVTTRLSQLSFQLNSEYSLQMKFLDESNSWDLFTKTVFGDQERCPRELEKIGKEIVSNCRGLPLSIVVVGGLLKKLKHTKACWESTRKNLTSYVNLDNDKHCLRLLKMSYNHLPVYLKPCFLYMGVFEEDDEIRTSTIAKLWVGEGFVKPIHGKSLEASAKEWIKELIDRNLILSHSLGKTGNIKYCKIHDLLRDLCLNQGKKDGFYHVVGQHCPRGINSQRRVVIPRNTSKRKVRDALRSMPHTRSVISEYGKVPQCQNSGLLKILHAYKFRTFEDNSYFHSLTSLGDVNLQHLAIEVRGTSSLFSSIHLLWNLQTLIVSCPRGLVSRVHESVAPAQLWRLPHIKHIEFPQRCFSLPDPPSNDVVIMENLQKLIGVFDFKFGEEVVERIPNIKKLEIEYHGHKGSSHDDHYNLTNIKRLSELESLYISGCFYLGDVASLHNNLTFPHSLQRLLIEVLPYFEFKDLLEKIGSLPHLQKLRLISGCFRGKWEIVEGEFPSLKYLSLHFVRKLESLAVVEDSSIFPCLEHLNLFGLEELKDITSEIGNISTLRKIEMVYCNESAVKCVKAIVEEQVEMQGELLFDVEVLLEGENEELQSMAGPYFKVL